jgi:hypothetical protein
VIAWQCTALVGDGRITEITLDRSGATKRELDLRTGSWSAGQPMVHAE